MLLPQRLEGLESYFAGLSELEMYFNELPDSISGMTSADSDIFAFVNQKITGYCESFDSSNEGNQFGYIGIEFSQFTTNDYILRLNALYKTQEKENAKVIAIILRDKNARDIRNEFYDSGCTGQRQIIKTRNLQGASDFLNKVLDKYNFHNIYDEFERRRNYEKEKQALLK